MAQIVNELFSPFIFSVHNFKDIKIQLSNDEVEFKVTPTSASRTKLNGSHDIGSCLTPVAIADLRNYGASEKIFTLLVSACEFQS